MAADKEHPTEPNNFILEILNDTSVQLLAIKEEKEIYKLLVEAIDKLIPGAYCVVSKLQEDDMNFRIIQTHGLDKFFDFIHPIIGRDFHEIDFPFQDLADHHRQGFEARKLYLLEDGLYGLSVGAINKTVCKAIEKLVGISKIYAISFFLEDKYFGGISIWIPKHIRKVGDLSQATIIAIETLSNLASVLIQRFRDSQSLRTSQNKVETSYNRLNLLVNNLTDIIWMANGDGSGLEDLNHCFERIYGHSSEEFEKDPNLWIDLVHPADKVQFQKGLDELLRDGKSIAEYRIILKDGSYRWLNDRKSIVFDDSGKPILMGGISTDITVHRRMEAELQEMISTKDKLFSILAHDLKSPINTFLGFTSILSNDYATTSDNDRLKYIHMLQDSAISTYKLLENLLEWSQLQINSYEMHKEWFNLKTIIDECMSIYSAMAENKQIDLLNEVGVETTIFMDGNAIKTVLRNLLNNALKYTNVGGTVTFSAQQVKDRLEISVKDTGVGIQTKDLHTLFDSGEITTTPGTKNEKGTGLGLLLCRELLERNSGALLVDSEWGKGSTFRISLSN